MAQAITIPFVGEAVHVFVQFDGDEEFSGPFDATVRDLNISSRPLPVLAITTDLGTPGRVAHFDAVPYGAGYPVYWLPSTISEGVPS